MYVSFAYIQNPMVIYASNRLLSLICVYIEGKLFFNFNYPWDMPPIKKIKHFENKSSKKLLLRLVKILLPKLCARLPIQNE